MIPALILAVLGLCALLLNLILIPILGTVYREGILAYLSAYTENIDDETTRIDDSVLTTMLTLIWIIIFIGACMLDFIHFILMDFCLAILNDVTFVVLFYSGQLALHGGNVLTLQTDEGGRIQSECSVKLGRSRRM